MIHLGNDIFVIKKLIPKEILNSLNSLRVNSCHNNRIDLIGENLKFLYQFNKVWMEKVEPVLLGEYLEIYDINKGIGYNISANTVEDIKQYCQTKWRDLFLLHYNKENSKDINKKVHWDFSGVTTVGALNDEYEGGELCFPRHNIQYKLHQGDIIIFPGGITHPHYVNPIKEGVRNVIVGQSLTLVQDHKIHY